MSFRAWTHYYKSLFLHHCIFMARCHISWYLSHNLILLLSAFGNLEPCLLRKLMANAVVMSGGKNLWTRITGKMNLKFLRIPVS